MLGQKRADPAVRRELDRFGIDARYFDDHRLELLASYPDRWVAVYGEEVVGADRNLKRLVRNLERKGIPPGGAYTEYLTEKDEVLILPGIR